MLKICKVILMMTAIALLITGCGSSSTPDIQEILQNTKENESVKTGDAALSDDTGGIAEEAKADSGMDETAADAQSQDTEEGSADTDEEAEKTICVFVCGEVISPGVYYFADGARKADAVEAAGGFTQEANTSYVNLAQLLTDEMQLYIPALGEETGTADSSAAATEAEAAHAGKINLNTATAAELCGLNGIGESKAAAILQYREENGGFETVDELTQVSGIGESTLEKIRDYIYVE